MPRSIKEPIAKPIIPESDDPKSIAWLANWFNNRREQLYNNFKDYPYGSSVDTYIKPNNKQRGDIRDDGWDVIRNENNYNPLELLKGNNPNRIRTNKIFYSLINSAASAPQHIIYPDNKSSNFNTRGAYVQPNISNNTGHI